MELIEVEKLRDEILYDSDYDNDIINHFLDVVDSQPTVDAEPVRRGKWIDVLGGYLFECSRCKAQVNKKQFKCNLKYCPNCGVKMQEEIENG